LYGKIEAPITLTYGENDWSQSQEREENKNSLSLERYVIFEKSGHFSALETPAQLANVI
jgi:pimeloyl-ACP methyl ester carboxylesterase